VSELDPPSVAPRVFLVGGVLFSWPGVLGDAVARALPLGVSRGLAAGVLRCAGEACVPGEAAWAGDVEAPGLAIAPALVFAPVRVLVFVFTFVV
jgi:hypothetical protein